MSPLQAPCDADIPSSTEPRGKSTDDVSPVVLHASVDPPLANTGPSSTSTTLDLSIFPTAIQAQLAQFTIDLQDYKSARTSLACNHCRSRKIKCSGDRPVCSACIKSGNGETCEYPQGHAKRRKRTVMESDVEREAERTAEQDVQREDTLQTKRHRCEREDEVGVGGRSTSLSSTSRFQTLRTAATLPHNPAKKPRTEDVETQQLQIEISGPAPDFVRSRGASELDMGLQSHQQQHEQIQGCDYDWSFFGEMHDTTTPSIYQAGPSEYSKTDYIGKGRRSRSVQEPTQGTDREPGCGGSTRLRVPYFR
jgi:hypothetical protein